MPELAWKALLSGESAALMAGAVSFGLLLSIALRATVAANHRERLRAPVFALSAAVLLWWLFQLAGPNFAADSALRFVPTLLILLAYGRLGTVTLFDWVLIRRLRRDAPRIVRDLADGLIIIVAVLVFLRAAGVEAVPLLTTSALLTAIVGLSLQDTLGNLLAGLVLQTQRPFDLGEWIQLDREGMQIGRVADLNWRSTKVLTLDHQELNVPNSQLVRTPILNLSRPSRIARRTIEIVIPYDFPTHQVREVIERAVADVPGMAPHPKPEVITHAFADIGIRYRVLFFLDDFGQRELVDSLVRDRIWYALHRAAIPFARGPGVAAAQGRVGLAAGDLETRTRAVRQVDFLRDLPDSAVAVLASDARTDLYAPGELIVRQGEVGQDLYVCLSGELLVLHTSDAGEQREVARIAPGGMFGEFAQLTGETRTASVRAVRACEVVVIGKAAFSSVLGSNPTFAELISQRLAERRAELDAAHQDLSPAQRVSVDEHKGRFLRRLRELLSL
jgi:small-conductance mechanosensitive channel/CRP-like cAMP-binding protein